VDEDGRDTALEDTEEESHGEEESEVGRRGVKDQKHRPEDCRRNGSA
jgi:hypothetical protein